MTAAGYEAVYFNLQEWVLNHGRSLKLHPLEPGENPHIIRSDLMRNGWHCDSLYGIFPLDDIDENDPAHFDRVFDKEKYIVLEQASGRTERLIITYSLKYKQFMQMKRVRDLDRADKLIQSKKLDKGDLKKLNDVTRYIKVTSTTADDEKADNTDTKLIKKRSRARVLTRAFTLSVPALTKTRKALKR